MEEEEWGGGQEEEEEEELRQEPDREEEGESEKDSEMLDNGQIQSVPLSPHSLFTTEVREVSRNSLVHTGSMV